VNPRSLPFTVYPKKTKLLLLLLISVVFVIGGVWMVRDGEKIGWLCVGFFALGILVFLIQLFPKSSFLTVSEEGLEFRVLFRSHKLPWRDISEFGVYTVPGARMVGFNYSSEYQRAPKVRAVVKALAGFEGALPDAYGFSAEELVQLLSTYHCEKTQKPHAPLEPESRFIVRLTDTEVACERPDGKTERVAWSDLQRVEVLTTSDGPMFPDVFWLLHGRDGGCAIPQGATGDKELLERLQTLPGFDNGKVIEAMGSTSDRRFLCWQRAASSSQ
jgi:hypothetical protein